MKINNLKMNSLQRTKPKGLIDLSCAYLYQVHDSFFEKKFCFQLVEKALPCLATVTYLACEDAGEFEVRIPKSPTQPFSHFDRYFSFS